MKAKLGVYVPVYGGWLRNVPYEDEVSYGYAEKVALRAEEIGIDSIWVPDHMLNPIKGEAAKSLEAWTTLTALAAVTEKVELFHTCICQGFRYPSVLAKMCTALSDVSEGRFRLAIGAGWFKREFEAYGVPWHDHDDKIERGREQIEIIKKFWKEPKFSYKGKFYEILDGVMEPKPEKTPAIWWAGESEKSRELVADEVDGWLFRGATAEGVLEKINDMERRLQRRGRGKIKYAMSGPLFMDETDEGARDRVKTLAGGNLSVLEHVEKTGFIGSPETIAKRIRKLDEVGVNYIIFQISPALNMLESINEKILPLLHG